MDLWLTMIDVLTLQKVGPQLTTFHLHPGDRHKTNRTPEETAEEKAPIQQIEHVFIVVYLCLLETQSQHQHNKNQKPGTSKLFALTSIHKFEGNGTSNVVNAAGLQATATSSATKQHSIVHLNI